MHTVKRFQSLHALTCYNSIHWTGEQPVFTGIAAMDDGIELNFATGDSVVARKPAIQKGGRWTDR
jgi:hypothetical protein